MENKFKRVEGGVTYPQGFKAAGIHCGLRKNKTKKDLALIVSDVECSAAAIYTTNKVYGAPITVTREHLKDGKARAVIVNSGNANTCNPDGVDKANAMCKALAENLGISENDVVVASTGVIGAPLPLEPIVNGIPELIASADYTPEAGYCAAAAIMTTDTRLKQIAIEYTVGDKTVKLGGMAKGSGMISPNMATMLSFVTTDAGVSPEILQRMLKEAADRTFNMISVDGDTSTNDSCIVLANGLAGNAEITSEGADYDAFLEAFIAICTDLARSMAADGEGAKHLITCVVKGACSTQQAETIGKSVIGSALTKSAIFGCDANWGRVLAAMGYSGETFDPEKVNVAFASTAGSVLVCKDGRGLDFDEELASKILSEKEVIIDILMAEGNCEATCWGCDLTYDYVRINGDYRT